MPTGGMGRTRRIRVVTLVAAGAALLLISVLAISRPGQPTYAPAAEGIALGPTTQHRQSSTDVFAQIATSALSTAAGSATTDLVTIGNAAPSPGEQALLDLTNA